MSTTVVFYIMIKTPAEGRVNLAARVNVSEQLADVIARIVSSEDQENTLIAVGFENLPQEIKVLYPAADEVNPE